MNDDPFFMKMQALTGLMELLDGKLDKLDDIIDRAEDVLAEIQAERTGTHIRQKLADREQQRQAKAKYKPSQRLKNNATLGCR